jgi:hypothetical protein
MAVALERARAELQQRDQELEAFRRQETVVQQTEVSGPGPSIQQPETIVTAAVDPGVTMRPRNSVEDSVTGRLIAADSSVVMAEAVTLSTVTAASAEAQVVGHDDGAMTAEMLESDEDYHALSAFLSAQGMSRHKEKLVENEVSFDTLLMFNEDDYKELGIAKGPRVKMLRTCQVWYQEQLDKLQQQR